MMKFSVIATVLVCIFTLSTARLQPGNDESTKIRLHSLRMTSRSKSPNRIPLIAHSFRPINRRFAMIKRSADLDVNEQSRFEIPIDILPEVNELHPIPHSLHYHNNHHDCNDDPNEPKHVEISYGNDMLVASSDPNESKHMEVSYGNDMLVASSDPNELKHVEISYGNDMLVASSENGVEQVFQELDPLGHSIYHHDDDGDDEDVKDTTNREELLRRLRGHRWDNMLKKMENHNKIQFQNEKKNKGDRFMNRIQEFFGQYF